MKAYLDTNVFINMLHSPGSSSAKIISICSSGAFTPFVSEYGIAEMIENAKRNLGKDVASSLRALIFSIPGLVIVKDSEIKDGLGEFKGLVKDLDDIPHIAACFHVGCEVFITSNRRLTQMKIKDMLAFKGPDEFLEMLQL
ncbi:PIN domain-containing protein [archaeon]|nr:PIN domain-containing protein [archaeon]